MASAKELSKDLKFLNLSAEAKKKVLLSIDPNFASASREAQDLIVSRLAGIPTAAELQAQKPTPGVMSQAWDALAVPERMSREGLTQLASFVPKPEPTGNLPLDIIKGAPRIAAETMAEAAPSFVSRTSILAAGAGPLARVVSKGAKSAGPLVAKALSRTSGINPKALEAAAQDAGTVFKPGIEKANKIYGELVGGVEAGARPAAEKSAAAFDAINRVMKGEGTVAGAAPKRIVDNALQLANSGELSPRMANVARKALDQLYGSKSISDDFFNAAKGTLKAVEGQSGAIAKAKDIRKTAESVDQLRQLFPLTKSGGTGQFRTMLSGAAAVKNPALAPVLGTAFSPAVQGAEAALAGLAVRRGLDPIANSSAALRTALSAALQNAMNRRKQNAR